MFNTPRARDLHNQFNSYQLANKLAHAEDKIVRLEKMLADMKILLVGNYDDGKCGCDNPECEWKKTF